MYLDIESNYISDSYRRMQELKFHYSLVKIPSIRRIVELWKYKFNSKDDWNYFFRWNNVSQAY